MANDNAVPPPEPNKRRKPKRTTPVIGKELRRRLIREAGDLNLHWAFSNHGIDFETWKKEAGPREFAVFLQQYERYWTRFWTRLAQV